MAKEFEHKTEPITTLMEMQFTKDNKTVDPKSDNTESDEEILQTESNKCESEKKETADFLEKE